jgi:hypothetical protein
VTCFGGGGCGITTTVLVMVGWPYFFDKFALANSASTEPGINFFFFLKLHWVPVKLHWYPFLHHPGAVLYVPTAQQLSCKQQIH